MSASISGGSAIPYRVAVRGDRGLPGFGDHVQQRRARRGERGAQRRGQVARLGTAPASLGPVGVAHYHLSWPGTLSLSPGTLIAVFNDVCGGLARAGARRILSVNWHEGNSATLRLAADQAQVSHGVQVVMAETHVITHTLFPDEMEFTHAGSMETAAVLAFDPALVHLEHATPASDRAAGEAAHALFRRPDVYPVMRDFHHVAETGWYGRPELATPDRAEEIAEAVADHAVARAKQIWGALKDRESGRA